MTYDGRSTEQIRDLPDAYLEANFDNPALQDVDMLGAIIEATARTISNQQEEELERLSKQAYLDSATGDALTRKAREYGVERRDAVRATGVVEFSRESDATTDYTIAEGTRVQTADGSVTFETTESATLAQGTSSVKVNARAVTGGTQGNLAANRLTTMPSPPTGVESVTNPIPTGDENETDTEGNTLVPGLDRETDEELRRRALASTSIGGAATAGAIETALLDVDGVRSVTVFPNPEDTTDANGLPPYSNEVVVSGGNDGDVAQALKEITSVTELYRLQSGIIGNGQTVGVYVNSLDQTVDVNFSRPVDVQLTVDVDVVTTDTYVGDDAIKDDMIEYVGGQRTDGSSVVGLPVNTDVVIDRLEDTIVGDDNGVQGIASMTVDATGDDTDDRTTNSDGIDVIPISKEEQASLDATDITITDV